MSMTLFSSFAQRGRVPALLLVVIGLLLVPAAAQATTITVNSTADSLTGCTLRNAITAANQNSAQGACPAGQPSPTVDTIDFSVPAGSTITLTSALDAITDDVSISGPGQGQLTVSGADTYHPLKVSSGAVVSISGLTISHGKWGVACSCEGGAISNSGDLTLNRVAVTQSSVTNVFGVGGGIYNDGTMTIQNSTVSSNTVSANGGANLDARGGGVFNAGTMTLVLSTVTGNTVSASGATNSNPARGGGVFNESIGDLTIDRSTIRSNAATANAMGGNSALAQGGAIFNRHNLTITRSTVSGNTASASNGGTGNAGEGGGIFNIGPSNPGDVTVTIDRSTLSDNTATEAGGTSEAGGMEILPGTYTIKSSTIAHNSAGTGANLVQFGSPTFKNAIVSDPEGGGSNCVGSPPGTSSYDLSSDGTCGFTGSGDHLSTNPMLAASLAFNGGPTKTYALQPASPAIDQGLSSAGETVDQRGIKRPSDFSSIANAPGGDGTDIGAFERSDPTAVIDSGPSGTTNDPTPTFTFHSKDGGSILQCKLDGGSFAACASPKTTPHLADGAHTFQVRARDALGNFGATVSRSFTVKTAAISRSGSTLIVTAAPGAKDNINITKPSASTIRVSDSPSGIYTGSGVHAVSGSGCVPSGDYVANCGAPGVALVKVLSGDQIDRVTNSTAFPSALNGGAANDVLTGGSANDTLTGGSGADTMKGKNGNDTLAARDNASDALIDCDGGNKPGTADKAILDALPNEPDSIVHGCETKARP